MKYLDRSRGFTLIEMMITILIIAVLAAMSITSYMNYIRRAHYSEVVQATSPFKEGVAECFQFNSDLVGCNGGTNHIPPDMTTPAGAVASITTADGVITATPVAANGIVATDTYILTPSIVNNHIIWSASGGGVVKEYAK